MISLDFSKEPLGRCASGAASANMALFHLFCAAPSREAARCALESAIAASDGEERARLLAAQSLWRDTPEAFELIKALDEKYFAQIATADRADRIAQVAAAYDAIADLSPSGSVASYSLGREDLLEKATAEVVAYLKNEQLVGHDRVAIEIGCGIGRFLVALAPELASITGVDVSARMIAHARERCERFANVALAQGDGRGLRDLSDARFDLALAIDSFPHIVEAGEEVAASNLDEIYRVLRPKGRFLIFNYSYRGDDGLDRRDCLRFAERTGFTMRRCGDRPFHLWDGTVFDLEKRA
ncbi:MAG TPA: class I SAM-dependent methyltransferase [Methylosinus sp.]|jgi:ubiquinone/menaquinone biosynthesis C-methylase UbiE